MKKYKIELTEYQLKALSSVLNKQARLIFGQLDIAIEDECLEALVKHRHNGNYQDAYDDKEKLEDCLESAYNVISKRTGKMVDGVFVKDGN